MKAKLRLAVEKLVSWARTVKSGFDIRDVFVFGGLAMLGYGLWLLRPWLGFAVSGFILMLIGYLMRGK